MSSLTIREAYIQASSFLQQKAVTQDPARVTEWMLLYLLGWSRTDFFLRWDEPFPEEKRDQWDQMVSRKAEGEPVQYIIGEQEFYGLRFQVSPAVLIPRPETEILVEKLIAQGNQIWPEGTPLLVDIGTGSGVIPISIALQCPRWQINASDLSAMALEVAEKNAQLHGIADRIAFYQGDLLEPFIQAGRAPNILVSNPPYIPTSEISDLQPEVQKFEPNLALDGGVDGLKLYRKLIDQMALLSEYPQLVGLEVGQGQALEVAAMLSSTKQWDHIQVVSDLSGIERHVIASQNQNE